MKGQGRANVSGQCNIDISGDFWALTKAANKTSQSTALDVSTEICVKITSKLPSWAGLLLIAIGLSTDQSKEGMGTQNQPWGSVGLRTRTTRVLTHGRIAHHKTSKPTKLGFNMDCVVLRTQFDL